MPKKTQRNAFYFFMKELEPQLRREGRVFPNGMADVVPLAHPRWKVLPAKEKERFENMAKEFKAKMRGVEGDKYRMDNKGNIIAYRKDETQELMNYLDKMGREVKAKWPPGRDVMNESFFLINIQTLCETEAGDFLPCEIACLEFSLQQGIIKKFHKFIDPGRIPIGFKYTCMKNSEISHRIPCEGFEQADRDYSWLWTQLKNFVNPNMEKDVYPHLYCRPSVHRETLKSLQWLHCMAGDRGQCKLNRLLNLEGLLQDLYTHMGRSCNLAMAVDILSSTSYEFVPNHMCKYHEDIECKYCSLGIINRYSFAMFDELADIYNIKLTTRHMPESSDRDLSVTVIPPPKHSIFPQPQVNRDQSSHRDFGGSRNYERGDGQFASRDYRYSQSNSQTSDSDREEKNERKDTTALRLPKTSGTSAGLVTAVGQGLRPPGGVGRGMPLLMEGTGGQIANSLAAAAAKRGNQVSATSQQSVVRPRQGPMAGVPVGRGMRPPVGTPPLGAPSHPGHVLPAAKPGVPPAEKPGVPPAAKPAVACTGFGRGVLGPLPHQITEFRVPVGRGFSLPAGW